MSNFYEERATMIAAGDLQEFVPFGRDHCKHHPNALNLQLRQLQPASELWSSDGAAGLESWQLRRGGSEIGEVDYDEELYVAGNMVIWSKGRALAVYKAFTVDSPVQQALWCDFIISQDKSEKAYSSAEVEKCICILQSSCINMHSIEGKDYIASLPFQVANVWPTKYGLLFERSSSSHEIPPGPPREPLPTLFSMLHPLDEITPLVCKSGSLFGSSRVQYVVDHAMKIVFLSTDPSIVMTYDTVQCLHSVWVLRRVKAEEENAVLKFSEQGGTPQNVAPSNSLTANLRSLSKGDSPVASPFQNYSSIHSQSRSTSSPSLHSRSPSISNMAALSCVKFQESNDKTQLIFGSITNIQAKDAAPVEKIDTMLVLESSGNLVLYTGVVRVGKVFIPGLPAPSLTMSNAMPRPSTPLDSVSTPTPLSKLLGTLDEVVLLSPVPELRDSSKLHDSLYNEDCTFQQLGTYIHSIRDPVRNRVTLELSNGSMVRITLPEIATSELVQTCLQAIKFILPKEIAFQMLVKWYSVHSAPGGPSYHSEWNLFVICLMNMMGYNTDRLAWTRNFDFEGSLSPVIAPKKARPSETGSDEDWEYLLNSDYHQKVESHLLNRSLCLSPLEVSQIKDEDLSQNLSLDSSTLLFSHIPAMFFVLHLVYEELKLNTLMGEGIHSLVDLLVQLARDLKLEPYLDHYYRDYPTLVRTTGQEDYQNKDSFCYLVAPQKSQAEQEENRFSFRHSPSVSSLAERLVVWMANVGFTLRDLETLPFGIALPIRDAIYHCREQPAADWPEAVCLLIGRQDLSKQACEGNLPKGKSVLSSDVPSGTETEEEDDGMNDMNQEVMSLIWSEDLRVQDVRRLLQSAHPVRVNVVQYPELSDHEFIEEKENRLLQLCQRTMALPVGRGMFTLFSYHPVPTEPLPIPKLNLTGRAPPRNTTVDLNSGNIDVPPNMTSWASFHNGVAAGLKIAPASQIDSAWIVYNKPKHAELANEYAGFLMALGLNGHLTKLATLNIHDYLTKVAAVVGIGLVYQGTAHRHTAEVLLAEIGRPPGPEMEYCTDRESYSLAAGLALGMVCLGEGDTINVDVTCPGATLALAMIYLKTNNRSIADWLRAPDTMYLLDFVKPEFLLLRTLARCLILWDDILPNSKWVDSNVPQHKFAKDFMTYLSAPNASVTGPYNLETCLSVVLLSLAMVMAGSGNLKVLQLCRFLHMKTGGEMNYGFHLAHHMALGILFLGGGRYSLSTSNSSIAALLCALYPHFPAHSTDNRYHLQALRHLYVLAAEPRLLVPVDVDTNTPCYALLEVTYKGTQWYEQTKEELMAPTLLPELHLLKQIKVKGPRYWELLIDLSKGTQHLKSILSKDGVLYVKLRAGQLSYKDDPMGWQSLLAQTVANRNSEARAFKKQELLDLFSSVLYECVTQETPEMLPAYIAMDQAVRRLGRREMSETSELWQIKLVLEFFSSRSHQERLQTHPKRGLFMNSEFLPVVKCSIDNTLDQWLQAGGDVCLHAYLSGQPWEESQLSMLACFLVYHSVPAPRHLPSVGLEGSTSFAELLFKCKQLKMPVRALLRLAPLLLGNPQPMVM
ncbi:Anaphase-promoting complex subunit 1 [Myotis davidii]|uniref:Anaphase-promoting complex subunit 1 n=1 Tax=Myotis davidii TaxID=225400 RepID=L5LL32_MYODS|nr:Anaphase-promoting complex subunit 1 [Myotis davidii]